MKREFPTLKFEFGQVVAIIGNSGDAPDYFTIAYVAFASEGGPMLRRQRRRPPGSAKLKYDH